MKHGSNRMMFAAGGATAVWLIGVALATTGAGMSRRLTTASSNQSNGQAAWEPVLQACGAKAFVKTASQTGPVSRPPMSDAAFKNIQVLKGIPVDQFMGTMGLFSAAMGECCLECHVPEWAADTPKKRTARRMVELMNSINQATFGGRKVVTCWTCHRGSNRPPVAPSLDLVYGEPILLAQADTVIIPPAEGVPPADQILDKYVQAIGGAERLANLKSFVGKGKATGYGAEGSPAEIFAQAPNQRTTIVHTADGDTTTTYDGRAAWQASPVTPVPVMELTGGELEGAKLDAELLFPGQIKQVLTNWRVTYPTAIGDRDVQVVQGVGDGGFIATLYFDQQSGLLTRVVRYSDSAVGRVPTQIDFADYREVAGVKVPFRWTLTWLTGRDVVELSEIQPNVPIDAGRFAKPAPAKRP